MAVKAYLMFATTPEGDDWVGPAPVSFNPDSLSIQVGAQKQEGGSGVNEQAGANPKAAQEPVVQAGGMGVKTVTMQLKFDMVDLYRQTVNRRKQQDAMDKVSAVVSSFDSANLMESAINGVGILMKPTDYTQISLLNPQYSPYSLLEQAAANNLPLGFLWGPMQFMGMLVSFSSQYVYFSEQGAPLRADVAIALRCAAGSPQGDKAMEKAADQQEQEAERTQPGAE